MAGLGYDSAFHAGGGLYKLKYLGLQSSTLLIANLQKRRKMGSGLSIKLFF